MRRGVSILLCASCAVGCAHSSRKLYGGTARYSSADHAWVAQQGENRWTFRDPVSGCALQCRADVARWNKVNAQRSHADKQDRGAPGTAALATLPLAIPAVILFLPT
jgi:hypothetical protein